MKLRVTVVIVVLICLLLPSITIGKTAPDFSLPSADGKIYRLKDIKAKVIVLNFWASWCPECLKELPVLEKFYKEYKTRSVEVIGINVDTSVNKAKKIIRKYSLSFINLMDTNGDVFVEGFNVIGLPTTVLIGPDREIVKTIVGPVNFESGDFKESIEKLLRR